MAGALGATLSERQAGHTQAAASLRHYRVPGQGYSSKHHTNDRDDLRQPAANDPSQGMVLPDAEQRTASAPEVRDSCSGSRWAGSCSQFHRAPLCPSRRTTPPTGRGYHQRDVLEDTLVRCPDQRELMRMHRSQSVPTPVIFEEDNRRPSMSSRKAVGEILSRHLRGLGFGVSESWTARCWAVYLGRDPLAVLERCGAFWSAFHAVLPCEPRLRRAPPTRLNHGPGGCTLAGGRHLGVQE